MTQPRMDEVVWRDVAPTRRPLSRWFWALAAACVALPLVAAGVTIGGVVAPRLTSDGWSADVDGTTGSAVVTVEVANAGVIPVTVTGSELLTAEGAPTGIPVVTPPTVVPARGSASVELRFVSRCAPDGSVSMHPSFETSGTWPVRTSSLTLVTLDQEMWCPVPDQQEPSP